ncbi:hypothetical protein SEVIR_7G284600v4 [Setaria viridis]|uniref:DUF4228 domain-containing protein n=2 Tax=Setaria TaxID=4554 RepID=K3YEN7_SETIT|nr:uncharacterized protein LOC101776297 [Setaria italica]XP_034604930.1 uncharacterized protein LOC117864979 [Setaria viridis]RCV35863.1 hypothetical protein SETIT_7G273700v2 [Setaria italica]TKW07086.1 hypothetical protein SEVIR_7G284600v2 [Setaria viridis]
MGNSLRCCLACVLPCGALDLIRIVHLNGRVEEYGRPVAAGEILAANPNHVLSKPCSQGVVRRILIVSPDSELERGEIYFLIPASSVPPEKKQKGTKSLSAGSHSDQLVKKESYHGKAGGHPKSNGRRDLGDALSQKRSSSHRRRISAGRTAVWKPHLECIVEDS